MNLRIKCEKCKTEFDAVIGVRTKLVTCKGKNLKLTYYDCPECKAYIIVQLDNEETLRLLNECTRLVALKVQKRKRGKDLNEVNQKKLESKQVELRELRNQLALINNGRMAIDIEGDKCGILDMSFVLKSKEAADESIKSQIDNL